MILREATVRYAKGVRVEAPKRIRSSRDVHALLTADPAGLGTLIDACVEHFVVIALDAKSRVIGWTTIGIGGLSYCPGAVWRFALLSNAASLILAHNHPSGDVTPSAEDCALTERLAKGGALLGLRILDHLIVSDHEYFSFLDAGLLAPP